MRRLAILILFVALSTGCGTWSTSGNFRLERGETLRGDLVVTSGWATLEEDSRVTGSVFMTSGNLDVQANVEIEGDVFLTSGNVNLGPGSVVRGDIVATSGNVNRADSARVEGDIAINSFSPRVFGSLCIGPLVIMGVALYALTWLFGQGRRRAGASSLVVGMMLIVLGVVLFAGNVFDLDLGNWWAWLILIPALGSLADVWRSYRTEGRLGVAARGPLVLGLALLVVALIFILNLSWGALWPVFVIIVGVGVLVAR